MCSSISTKAQSRRLSELDAELEVQTARFKRLRLSDPEPRADWGRGRDSRTWESTFLSISVIEAPGYVEHVQLHLVEAGAARGA